MDDSTRRIIMQGVGSVEIEVLAFAECQILDVSLLQAERSAAVAWV